MAEGTCAAKVSCVLVLVVVLGVMQSEAQFLPHLLPTGQGVSGVHRVCDDCSDSIQLNISFPFGDYCHTECHVGSVLLLARVLG